MNFPKHKQRAKQAAPAYPQTQSLHIVLPDAHKSFGINKDYCYFCSIK